MSKSRETYLIVASGADRGQARDLYTRRVRWVEKSSNVRCKWFNINEIGIYNVVRLEVERIALLSQSLKNCHRLVRIQQWAGTPSGPHP